MSAVPFASAAEPSSVAMARPRRASAQVGGRWRWAIGGLLLAVLIPAGVMLGNGRSRWRLAWLWRHSPPRCCQPSRWTTHSPWSSRRGPRPTSRLGGAAT